jgi:hypothetical protein
MTAPETLSQPVLVNRSDGSELVFKRLAPSDRIKFRNAFALSRKIRLRENLLVVGIAGDAALKHLNEFDARPVEDEAAVEWVNDKEGRFEAVLLSLRKDKPDAKREDVDALNLNDGDMLTVAAGVLNLVLVPKSDRKEGQSPLPPGAAGPTDSGAATRQPSAATSTTRANP